jgi:hypothetical protein
MWKHADPARQFDLVREHIQKIRQRLCWMDSCIKIYVERNLGFEAEHHARDLGSIPGVIFHQVRVVWVGFISSSCSYSPSLSCLCKLHVGLLQHPLLLLGRHR